MKGGRPTTSIADHPDDWYALEEEVCSWQLTTNRSEIRDLLDQRPSSPRQVPTDAKVALRAPGDAVGNCVVEALIVSREDAESRAVRNHDSLVATVHAALAHDRLRECAVHTRVFVGRDHGVASTEHIWRRADVVVAPHGAALAWMLFMRPGTHVIELGYHSGSGTNRRRNHDAALGAAHGMPWPAPYYWVVALSANVHLYASMAQGSYGGAMTANLTDVAHLVRDRITPKLAAFFEPRVL